MKLSRPTSQSKLLSKSKLFLTALLTPLTNTDRNTKGNIVKFSFLHKPARDALIEQLKQYQALHLLGIERFDDAVEISEINHLPMIRIMMKTKVSSGILEATSEEEIALFTAGVISLFKASLDTCKFALAKDTGINITSTRFSMENPGDIAWAVDSQTQSNPKLYRKGTVMTKLECNGVIYALNEGVFSVWTKDDEEDSFTSIRECDLDPIEKVFYDALTNYEAVLAQKEG